MFDQQHPGAARGNRLDQAGQPLDLVTGEPGGRLIEQQEVRIEHQRAGNLDEAKFAVLQAIGADIGQRLQPDDAKHAVRLGRQHALVAVAARQRQQCFGKACASLDGAADHDVLQHRGFADHARRLEGAGDALAGAQWRLSRRQHIVAQFHGAALGRVVAGDHVQRRGLAAAIGADQAVDLAGMHVEIKTVDGADIAEAQDNTAQAERPAAGGFAHDIAERRRPRHDGAVACQGPAVAKVEQAGDTARQHQHDYQ